MLRTPEESSLDRTFESFGSWEEFLELWKENDCFEIAKSLLYVGTEKNRDHLSKSYEEVLKKQVKFYLLWSTHKDSGIAETAKQIVIKHWLRQVISPIHRIDIRIDLHASLLDFLNSDFSENFFLPPYPRFVGEYLLELHRAFKSPVNCSESCNLAIKCHTRKLVRAMLNWGVSYALAGQGPWSEEMIEEIADFIQYHKYPIGEVLMGISGHGEPPDRIKVKRNIETAAKALLKITYWQEKTIIIEPNK